MTDDQLKRDARAAAEKYAEIWSEEYRVRTGHMGYLAYVAGYLAHAERAKGLLEALEDVARSGAGEGYEATCTARDALAVYRGQTGD